MDKRTKQATTTIQTGLVVSYFGNSVAVEVEDGQVFQCHLKRNQELPVVGDKVKWQIETGQTGIITAIEPRRSQLLRGDGYKKNKKPIAANVDLIAIVMAPPPVLSEYLLDRYLIAAELLHIPALIILNKIDLLGEQDKNKVSARLDVYRRIGYTIVFSSALSQAGLIDLGQYLKNKTAVLVGPSGVGKSSIIAHFTEGESVRIGSVSDKGLGKHTTTVTRLYHLAEGGQLIDSPGVREFNLWKINKEELLLGFKEFQPFKNGCKFRDCQHIVEPGCAVQAAVTEGKIAKERYANYQTLMKQISNPS